MISDDGYDTRHGVKKRCQLWHRAILAPNQSFNSWAGRHDGTVKKVRTSYVGRGKVGDTAKVNTFPGRTLALENVALRLYAEGSRFSVGRM